MSAIKLGTGVRWTSQASGVKKQKIGRVCCVVKPEQYIADALRDSHLSMSMFRDTNFGPPRDHESYLVEVVGSGDIGKPRIYWPIVDLLQVYNGDIPPARRPRSMRFKVGEGVSWSSQASGSMTTKVGKVLAVIQPLQTIVSALGQVTRITYDRIDACTTNSLKKVYKTEPRDHESYLIEVPGAKGRKPTLYRPVVARLRRF